jgi:D-methionine transport system permease protein
VNFENLIPLIPEILRSCLETGIMLSIGLTCALIFGGALGIALYLWQPGSPWEKSRTYHLASLVINLIRSVPFLILMVCLIPITRILAGSTIGPIAASVPLSLSAIPYFARLVESSLEEIPRDLIEAALAMGSSMNQVIFRVLLVEARPALILNFTTLAVSFLSYSAAAGVVGGGGIGDLAIRYGYYRYQTEVMIVMVALLVGLVQFIQYTGRFFARRYNHR